MKNEKNIRWDAGGLYRRLVENLVEIFRTLYVRSEFVQDVRFRGTIFRVYSLFNFDFWQMSNTFPDNMRISQW